MALLDDLDRDTGLQLGKPTKKATQGIVRLSLGSALVGATGSFLGGVAALPRNIR